MSKMHLSLKYISWDISLDILGTSLNITSRCTEMNRAIYPYRIYFTPYVLCYIFLSNTHNGRETGELKADFMRDLKDIRANIKTVHLRREGDFGGAFYREI